MHFLDLVRQRQSCRAFTNRPVPRDLLEHCCEAARLAPSACNSQPWFFHIVEDPTLRQRLADAAFSGPFSMCAFAKTAPVLVVIETLRPALPARLGGWVRGVYYPAIDVGIAVEHFVLQATEEGLATLWLGWFNARAVRSVLGLPRSARLDVMLAVGYPAERTLREKLRKPLEQIRRYL
ncbi:MAG: nitroreductase family protein [bacterium]|nr:nitroreductase family protein [bacterium]